MKTRASTKVETTKAKENERKNAILEKRKQEYEKWIADPSSVVDPCVPDPTPAKLEIWKLFMSFLYNHPNILVHPDVQCFKDLIEYLGKSIDYETHEFIIELDEQNNEDMHILQPCTSFSLEPLCTAFCNIEELKIIPNTNAVAISRYSVIEDAKMALLDLVDFTTNYPEIIYYPRYAFIYEFFLHFGVSTDSITYEIFQTQLRRAQLKWPASTLLLKQRGPENIVELSNEDVDFHKDNLTCDQLDEELNNDDTVNDKKCFLTRSNCSGSISGSEGDSGIGSNLSSTSTSSISDGDIDILATETKPIVFGRKSIVSVKSDDLKKPFKPYKCTKCCRSYRSKGNLTKHFKKYHSQALFLHPKIEPQTQDFIPAITCPFCNKIFSGLKFVKTHIEKYHPEPLQIPLQENSSVKIIRRVKPKEVVPPPEKVFRPNPYVLLMPLKPSPSECKSKYVFKRTYKKRSKRRIQFTKVTLSEPVASVFHPSCSLKATKYVPLEIF